jgi:hypothetical protein
MDRFWDLLERSIIIQGVVTLLFTITVVVMLIKSLPIANEVWIAYGAILGYWFGTKAQSELSYQARKARERGKGE